MYLRLLKMEADFDNGQAAVDSIREIFRSEVAAFEAKPIMGIAGDTIRTGSLAEMAGRLNESALQNAISAVPAGEPAVKTAGKRGRRGEVSDAVEAIIGKGRGLTAMEVLSELHEQGFTATKHPGLVKVLQKLSSAGRIVLRSDSKDLGMKKWYATAAGK